ncbi:hypothetical protein OO013_02885 [Mangrovivirga sp. M17]|uniref:Uncharacterized protein n=1 Tax=Mangrovivirga halotolerans TaxID=2993936 RepID=A0ABT3RLV1_9BACT|nr:hypothetical protein [Mangrovivirga halotolerans]MCX2742793.1 hypothetical protein [Mangrovivirga halotolerans]
MKPYLHILVIALSFFSFQLSGQEKIEYDSTKTVYLTTKDKAVYRGKITDQSDNKVFLQTEKFGLLHIYKEDIREIEIVDGQLIKKGKVWHDHIYATRYILSGNAIPLEKGQGYYNNLWIFSNNLNYGITNNFSVSTGVFTVFDGSSGIGLPFWVSAKYSFNKIGQNMYFSIGAMGLKVFNVDMPVLGAIYGATTFGDKNRNLTLGLGVPYQHGYGLVKYPLGKISGAIRVSKSTYLTLEGFIAGINFIENQDLGEGMLLTIGGKSGSKNISFNYGAILAFDFAYPSFIVGIPVFGITVPFGKK